MSITSAIVLYAMLWFLVLLVVLPIRLTSQDEAGAIVPGTPKGAPHDPQMKKRAKITTLIAAALWCVIAGVIYSGVITVRDFDVFDVMSPLSSVDGTGG